MGNRCFIIAVFRARLTVPGMRNAFRNPFHSCESIVPGTQPSPSSSSKVTFAIRRLSPRI
ncbi:hypothetical protein PIIN_11587 [Serendipita indica DSM 11827]|uniref:Uncharacterized protein n=1 Tax=Serendipita indica (strain DSM 11827) TaxID=1109443 RepID=G4U217_SERID|nr:hypothetical protein PIIN_11587 [Serendipita indica DSM 11827]